MEEQMLRDYVVGLRRAFHQEPELGLKEFETSRRVQEELSARSIPFHMVGETGVVAEISGGRPGPTVLLRADMDALPIQEATGLPFASRVPGVMHACGHDAHTAMLLGAAALLWEEREALPGRVRLVFEPAEEFAGAGRALLEAGILDGVDTVFAVHVAPNLPCGAVSVQPGVRMSGCGFFSLTVRGKSGHGSAPHEGIDVIPAACAMVSALQTVVSREVSPRDFVVITVGTFHAGTAANILAGEAKLTGTIRYQNPALKEMLPAALERVLRGTAEAFRVTIDLKCGMGLSPVVNDAACSAVAERAAAGLLEAAELPMGTGSDDFSYYTQRVPGVYAFLGTGGDHPIHHECFTLDEDALAPGSRLYARYAEEYLRGGCL
ncbi:M20 family metallopeptidase [uncultured Pseudoflavonifractor sp.]|uniref:M20 metallopeptidase family protein n=1 Tax=uncultured Pseudoflavonifractor sp. TaxID=1221379 RepID=UPI0025FCC4B4|nr:amidohydrolase [uncultured Pseudoflavonifractor sp.]